MNNSPLISYTETEGYKRSLTVSPAWNVVFRTIELLAKKFKVKTMAEIGVARGHQSAHLLEAIFDLHLFSVDPWGYYADEYDNMYNYHTLADDEKIYQQAAELLKNFGSRSTIMRTTSKRALNLIDKPLDMVYLDGDHSYEGVKEDMANWLRKLKVGGILSGNAYGHSKHPGVAKAVNEFVENKKIKLNLEVGMVWWLTKPIGSENNSGYNPVQLKPPFYLRLKRKIRRFFIILPIKIKALIKKIHGAKPAYSILKKLWK